ncbi:MAG TPA: hypothetical protein VLH94_03330 [Spirochaetia bacterium]|nr:hypothetical protein [Spirochaetia bacterium]
MILSVPNSKQLELISLIDEIKLPSWQITSGLVNHQFNIIIETRAVFPSKKSHLIAIIEYDEENSTLLLHFAKRVSPANIKGIKQSLKKLDQFLVQII